ncbi:MAG TPA: biosynthetic peptidoglycan transglycosylase [Xanthobacteraceae bacterium]|nr:biosynthetic peptidoglycan transglycosylase [Xanthobacteraceae bacterium]
MKPVNGSSRHVRNAATVAAALAVLALLAFFPPMDRQIGAVASLSDDGATVANYPDWLRAQSIRHHRVYVDYSQMPSCLDDAIVSVEDKRFFLHGGVDPLALARVFVEDAQNDHVDHGGSTITLQLARMILHVPRRQPSAFAKLMSELRIMRAGLIVEHDFSKQKILELYLNGVYLGRRATGVQAAAEAYFNAPLQQINRAQCIYLAGLPNDPARFGADPSGERAMARYRHVIATMERNGYLTDRQAVALNTDELYLRVTEK